MRWRLLLLLSIGLMYYGYVTSTADRAMAQFAQWQSVYLTTIDQAAAGSLAPSELNSK